MKYAWRKIGEASIPIVKHDGGSIMLWGNFSASGEGTLHRIQGVMRKEYYTKNLEENLKKDARKLGLGRIW